MRGRPRCDSSCCGAAAATAGGEREQQGSPAVDITIYRGERGFGHAPGILGPVFDTQAMPYTAAAPSRARRCSTSAGISPARSMTALAGRPQRPARERSLAERAAPQFAAPYGLGQDELGEAFAQQA